MAKATTDMGDFKYWIALDSIAGLGHKRFETLLAHFGSLQKAWHASADQIAKSGLDERSINKIVALRNKAEPDQFVQNLQKLKMKAICRNSPEFPPLLKEIYDPPNVLYHSGTIDFDGLHAVAIVGTRLPTAYGKRIATRLAGDLASAGLTIVSGLARGVDSIAHEAALKSNGNTVAVLGGALNKLYPADHSPLARRIVQSGGGVLTEFPPDVRALKQHFPRRNRIISGLVAGVIVIEGKHDSGSLITAQHGLEQGRDVFAIPGNITDDKSGGPNELIKDARAKLITSADDVLDEMNLRALTKPIKPKPATAKIELDDNYSAVEKQILTTLAKAGRPIHVDELSRMVKKPVSEVNTSIVMLELGDKVKRVAAMTFAVA